jgi:hypothetical protein
MLRRAQIARLRMHDSWSSLMAEKRKLEFFLLRYVPNVVRGEFVNFGVVALQAGESGTKVVDVRYARDWERVLRADPQADTAVLEALRKELQLEIGQNREKAVLLRRMEDSFSGVVQISRVLPVVTERQIADEVQAIAGLYLEGPKLQRMREPTGRRAILETMRNEFEKAGILDLLVPVPVESYTKSGDPLSFDFGYRAGSEIKLFHAVSMLASVDAAVLLAARYQKIAPVMAEKTSTVPLLTAVIEAGLDRSREEVGFALEMMEESKIRVADTAEMPRIAELARRELGA